MACPDDDCEAPAGCSDRELPRLIVELTHDVVVIDLMFGNLITRSRRGPMPINGHPNVLLFH
jgi:hypothetical protein